jgi:signal peptidase I
MRPWSLPLFDGRIVASQPERGDVVVFKLPADDETDFIKRVIGLPGDRIQVKNGILRINGEPVKRERVKELSVPAGVADQAMVTAYIETLPNGRQHRIWERSDRDFYDNTPVYTVPEGHYFMMGDNRDSSQDSRALGAVGYVPFENLVGRAEFIFFSHNGNADLWEVWRWPWAIRFDRIGEGIE